MPLAAEVRQLFANNRAWAERLRRDDPGIFERLRDQQAPQFLWVGCSDSRVPANEIIGLAPGEVFVHRNVANVVRPDDLNCQSVLQYAVDILRVRHVIVCGHYGCGGVQAAHDDLRLGLVDDWLEPVRALRRRHAAELEALAGRDARHRRLCELNVMAQVENVCGGAVVQEAWARGQPLAVHGFIYGIEDALLRDLEVSRGPGA
jgi:carbonic anhydrase